MFSKASRIARKRKPQRHRSILSRRPSLQNLERRQLLAVDVFELSELLPENGGDGSVGEIFLDIPNEINGEGSEPNGNFSTGDVNGDGFDDLAFLASQENAAGQDSMVTYVLFGSGSGLNRSVELENLAPSEGFKITGLESGRFNDQIPSILPSLSRVDVVGDMNGDGFDDLVLNTPLMQDESGNYRGGAFVVYGASTLPSEIDLQTMSASDGFRISMPIGTPGFLDTERVGDYVGGTGDINNDGLDDLLISLPADQVTYTEAAVIFGSSESVPGGELDLSDLNESQGFFIDVGVIDPVANQPSHGDLNGDGIDDILLGQGSVLQVAFGRDSTTVPSPFGERISLLPPSYASLNPDLAVMQTGEGFFYELGNYRTTHLGGDINGDGIDDLLIGDSAADVAERTTAGTVRVVYGRDIVNDDDFPVEFSNDYLDGDTGITIIGAIPGAKLGRGVGVLPDINNDGRDEVVIGFRMAIESGNFDGPFNHATLIYGRDDFPQQLDTYSLTNDDARIYRGLQDRAGIDSISGSPDFNGDGSPDLVLASTRSKLVDFYTLYSLGDSIQPTSDLYTGSEDETLIVSAPGVLANDSNPNESPLTAALVDAPTNGTLSLADDGSFTYQPSENFFGSDAFTYTASSGSMTSAPVTVNLTIEAVNDAPVALGDSVTTEENTVVTIDVLANDSDADGDALTTELMTNPEHGSVILNEDGTFSYTPAENYFGSDSFRYRALDWSQATSEVTTVKIEITESVSTPNLTHGVITNVSAQWQTVDFGTSYESAIVVATPQYLGNSGPGVTRIRNITSTSFEVQVANVGSTPFTGNVHFVAIEEGVYNEPGFKLEAVQVSSDATSRRGKWVIDTIDYQQLYDQPVVVGQVMSANDDAWSTFWASSNQRNSPPSSEKLNLGKHVGEDPNRTRSSETIGYFVIEATQNGSIDGIVNGATTALPFVAGVGADSVRVLAMEATNTLTL